MGRDRDWDLYVDESGPFDEPAKDVAVAGLLVDREAAGFRPGSLEEALRRVAPSLPWPFHAAYLNIPAFHALGGALAGAAHSRYLNRARAVLERAEPDALTNLSAAVRTPGAKDYALWQRADWILLTEDRALHTQLVGEAARVRAEIGRLLAEVAATGSRQGTTAWLMACGEARRGDAEPTADDPPPLGDRYCTMLECLIERVAAVLRNHGGRHRVFLHALSRDVQDPRLRQRVPLHPSHLEQILQRVRATATGDVRLISGMTPRYVPGIHAALVMSDFAANRTRLLLASPRRALSDVEIDTVASVGLGCRSGSPSRSHLAATGAAWEYVRAVDGSNPPPLAGARAKLDLPDVRRWAREQAVEWREQSMSEIGT